MKLKLKQKKARLIAAFKMGEEKVRKVVIRDTDPVFNVSTQLLHMTYQQLSHMEIQEIGVNRSSIHVSL